eukprot:jgi/Bigna1/79494/fgenesh1_pg.62_\
MDQPPAMGVTREVLSRSFGLRFWRRTPKTGREQDEMKRLETHDNVIMLSVLGASAIMQSTDVEAKQSLDSSPLSAFISGNFPENYDEKRNPIVVEVSTGPGSEPQPFRLRGDNGEFSIQVGDGQQATILWEKILHYRILTVNDVYELENLARFKTCEAALRTPNFSTTLAGDFVSPSLLSSLDKGKAMVDTMNKAGIDMVCFGNHEADIPPVQRQGESCIIKTGADAINFGICDVYWPMNATKATEYAKDKFLEREIVNHEKLLKELERAALCKVPKLIFVKRARKSLIDCSQRTLLANSLRDALGANACMIPAGMIRGNADYPAEMEYLTYAHLKKVWCFRLHGLLNRGGPSRVVSKVPIPGSVIQEVLCFSRSGVFDDVKKELAMFQQIDNRMRQEKSTDDDMGTYCVIDMKRMYNIVLSYEMCQGMDRVTPLLKYFEQNPKAMPRDLDNVKVDYFAKCAWVYILDKSDFHHVDTDGDGVISKKEVSAVAKQIYGEGVGSLVVDNLMACADIDQNDEITKDELFWIGLLGVVGFISADDGRGVEHTTQIGTRIGRRIGSPVLKLDIYREKVLRFFGTTDKKKVAYIEEVFSRLKSSKLFSNE